MLIVYMCKDLNTLLKVVMNPERSFHNIDFFFGFCQIQQILYDYILYIYTIFESMHNDIKSKMALELF